MHDRPPQSANVGRMTLSDWLKSTSASGKAQAALAAWTTVNYLHQLAGGHRRAHRVVSMSERWRYEAR